MLVFVIALKIEAAPFIRFYRLKRDMSVSAYPVYRSGSVLLIVSGTGKIRSAAALSFLLGRAEIKPDEALLVNFGFCGSASSALPVGRLVLAGLVHDTETGYDYFPGLLRHSPMRPVRVNSVSARVIEQGKQIEQVFEMEASGFFVAAERFTTTDRILILKLVSDRLIPDRLDPALLSDLILNQIENINGIVTLYQQTLLALDDPAALKDRQKARSVAARLGLTFAMTGRLEKMVRRYRLSGFNPLPFLENCNVDLIKSKKERTDWLDSLEKQWFG